MFLVFQILLQLFINKITFEKGFEKTIKRQVNNKQKIFGSKKEKKKYYNFIWAK